jgi:hypothetical protein
MSNLARSRFRPPPPAARDPCGHLDAIDTHEKAGPKAGSLRLDATMD